MNSLWQILNRLRPFVWLRICGAFLLKLVIAPPPKSDPMFDKNGKCPCCGHRQLKPECVTVTALPGKGVAAIRKAQLLVTCEVCKGWFFLTPLGGTDADKIHGRELQGLSN